MSTLGRYAYWEGLPTDGSDLRGAGCAAGAWPTNDDLVPSYAGRLPASSADELGAIHTPPCWRPSTGSAHSASGPWHEAGRTDTREPPS
jgi:hypothetical protein